jgi:hypothetical protein
MKESAYEELIELSKRSLQKFKDTGVVGSWSEDDEMDKRIVEFTCYKYHDKDGVCTLFLFSINGVWDECKRGLEESIKKYPYKYYEWVFDEKWGE